MTKHLLTLFTILFMHNAQSQISVTVNHLMNIVDVIHEATDTIPAINTPGDSGANIIWDFSSLLMQELDTTVFIDPSGTPDAADYPTANLCIDDDGDYTYIEKLNTGISVLGDDNAGFEKMLVLPLPLSYGMNHNSTPIVMMDTTMFNNMIDPMTVQMLTGGQIQSIDSIQISASYMQNFNVNAHGTLQIPSGSYDALRVKVTAKTQQKLYAYYNNAWQPMPAPISQMFFGSPSPLMEEKDVSYQWWTNQSHIKFIAMYMEVDSADIAEDITFNVDEDTSSSSSIKKIEANFSLYPNPSESILKLDLRELSGQHISYNIYAYNGALMGLGYLEQNQEIDVHSLPIGQYILELNNGIVSMQKTFVKN